MNKKMENVEDYGCMELKDLVDPKADEEMGVCSSYPFRHKASLQCAECKAKKLGNWTMQHLTLYTLFVGKIQCLRTYFF